MYLQNRKKLSGLEAFWEVDILDNWLKPIFHSFVYMAELTGKYCAINAYNTIRYNDRHNIIQTPIPAKFVISYSES